MKANELVNSSWTGTLLTGLLTAELYPGVPINTGNSMSSILIYVTTETYPLLVWGEFQFLFIVAVTRSILLAQIPENKNM